MRPEFFNISYLQRGSTIQKRGHDAIQQSNVLEQLNAFNPVVVGTLPLDLFLETSDIDIICFAPTLEAFAADVESKLRPHDEFSINSTQLRGGPGIVAKFLFQGFLFEVVAQATPVREQYAYRHLVAEWDFLQARGPEFKNRILELKQQGIKTEPAFAQALQLVGDPYESVLRA